MRHYDEDCVDGLMVGSPPVYSQKPLVVLFLSLGLTDLTITRLGHREVAESITRSSQRI